MSVCYPKFTRSSWNFLKKNNVYDKIRLAIDCQMSFQKTLGREVVMALDYAFHCEWLGHYCTVHNLKRHYTIKIKRVLLPYQKQEGVAHLVAANTVLVNS